MAWRIWCEIVCLECADTVAGRFNSTTLNKNKMRVEAYKAGWKIVNDDWLCKGCLKNENSSHM